MKQQVGVEVGGVVRGGVRRRRVAGFATLALALALCALGSGASSALAAPPTISAVAATEIGVTSARGHAKVTTNGEETFYRFDLISDAKYDENVTNGLEGFAEGRVETGGGSFPADTPADTQVEPALEGLAAGTEYHLRFVAVHSGEEEVFTIAPNFTTDTATVPTLAIAPPTEVKYTSAHIDATLNPEGGNANPIEGILAIGWEVQINREGNGWEGLVSGVIEGSEATATTPIAIPADLTGLQNGAEYKVRLRAAYAGNIEALSSEEEFETETVSPPLVSVDDASLLTGTSARFTGSVDPNGIDPTFYSSCLFEYITDAAFQSRAEVKRLVVKATGGAYTLSFEGETTAPIDFDATASEVQAALGALAKVSPGAVAVSGGPGDEGGTSPYVFTFPGADVGSLDLGSSTLTAPGAAEVATMTSGTSQYDEIQRLSFTFVRNIGASQGTETVDTATGGTYTLAFEGEETAPLAFDADAVTVQAALEALPTIGAGNVSVSGSDPSLITFTGTLAKTNVPPITVDGSSLTVSGTASPQTLVEGHPEGFAGAQTAECTPPLVESSGPVKADVTGLEPHTTYHLRLKATNAGGSSTALAAPFTTEAVAPTILETAVSDVTGNSATLQARINPGGDATTFHFEYLTLAAYEAASGSFAGATQTPESASIGAGNDSQNAAAPIEGLAPGTAYRYRVVATNSKSGPGGTAGPARSFTTTTPPVEKAEACPNRAVREQQGSTFLTECRAYEIVNNPGLDLGDASRVPQISDDGEYAATYSVVPGDEAHGGATAALTLSHRTASGWVRKGVDPDVLGGLPNYTGVTTLRGFSADFSKALISTILPASPDDVGAFDPYIIDVSTGVTTLFSVPSVPASSSGNIFGASDDLDRVVVGNLSPIGLTMLEGNGDYEFLPNAREVGGNAWRGTVYRAEYGPFVERGGNDALSADGGRLYYALGAIDPPLFLRDFDTDETIPVGRSQRAATMGEHFPTNFLGASNDGSSAFIFSLEPLTEDAAPGGGIYRFDLQTRSLTLLTPPAGSPDGFRLRNALPSDDMSHIYFNARSALDGGAVDGDENAYVWTQAGGVRFVGKVTAEDAFVNTTPDGRFALLSTAASIAGAPTNGKSSLYEYDDQSGELKCVTCRPDGSPSQGTATLNAQSPSIPACSCSHARGLTFDGRVFFTTDDSLVARDQNMVRDVYMYDNASGKVALISSGQSNIDSYLGENSDDGRHVFVVTRESLVGADRDPAEFDVYDAHVEGGFLEAAAPAAPCGGEACRTQTSATPVPASPTTQNFIGPGIPKPCAKGKTRRNGRCVKQRKPHKHKNKKHTKKHKGSHRDANSNRRTGR